MTIKKIPNSLKQKLQEIMNFPNHGNDKGYTGSHHIDLPNKIRFHLELNNVITLCKIIVDIYRNQWGNLPGGGNEKRVLETADESYIKLCKELKQKTGQTTPLSLLKNIFPEFDRFGLIERDMENNRFRITSFGKDYANADIESMKRVDLYNMMQKMIQNRFANPIWEQYLNHVHEIVDVHQTIYWFDLWILAFTVGDNPKYDLDYASELLTDIRKWCGLQRRFDESKLVSLNRTLIEEFTNLNNQSKYDKIDTKQLSFAYSRMADLLRLTGMFTLTGSGQDLFLKDSGNPYFPKPIRRNKTDESGYNQSNLQKQKQNGVQYDNHHIIAHAKGKIYNGLNNAIENKLNLIRISKEDHDFFDNNPDTPFKILDVVDGMVCFRSENNKKNIFYLKEQTHFDIDVIRSKFIPYNTKLLKKIK